MGRAYFMRGMQGFMALHARNLEADYTARARVRASEMEYAMRQAKPSGLLGDGRLADIKDAEAAELFDPSGLFLGSFEERLLFFGGGGPLLTYLRTGGGKGRDLILTNLAHSRGRSLFVTDLKDGENSFAACDHRASTGSHCVNLNPFGLRGVADTKINPLQQLIDIVERGDRIDTEAKGIAQILLPPSPKPGDDQWVRKGAVRLLVCRMEYLAHFDPGNCRLDALWQFVNGNETQLQMDFAMMATCGIESIERRAGSLELTHSKAPKQFEAYKSDAIEALDSFEPGKALAIATSVNEFDFARMKHAPHSVFLMVPADKIDVAAPWVSLIINFAIESIAKEAGPIRTTFLLDEFPQLPPAPAIMKALRVYREKGVQLWFFAQGRFSLTDRWSREAVKEFEDQAAIITFKGVREPELIRDIELWSGNMTVISRGVSHSGGTVETAGANLGETRRAVLQSESIVGLDEPNMIIRAASMPRLLIAQAVPFYAVEPWRNQLRDVRLLHKGTAK